MASSDIKSIVEELERALDSVGKVIISEKEREIINTNLEINKKNGKDPYYYLTEIDPRYLEEESDDELTDSGELNLEVESDLTDELVAKLSKISINDKNATDLLTRLKDLQTKFSTKFDHLKLRTADYKAPFPRPQLPSGENPRFDVLCFFLGPAPATKVLDLTDSDWNSFKNKENDRYCTTLQQFSTISGLSLDQIILADAFPHIIWKDKVVISDEQFDFALQWVSALIQIISPSIVIAVGSQSCWSVHLSYHSECPRPTKNALPRFNQPLTSPIKKTCPHQSTDKENQGTTTIFYSKYPSQNTKPEEIKKVGDKVKELITDIKH